VYNDGIQALYRRFCIVRSSLSIFKTLCLLSLLLVGAAVVPGQSAWSAPLEKDDACCKRESEEGRTHEHDPERDCCNGFCHVCCARAAVKHVSMLALTYEQTAFEAGTAASGEKPTDGQLAGTFHPPKA